MEKKTYDEILDEQISLLAAGATIEQCVAAYPEHAIRLREELAVAQDLMSSRSHAVPDSAAQARGRARLLAAAAEQRRAPGPAPAYSPERQ